MVFQKRDLVATKGLNRLINRKPKENFMIELENLLCDHENCLDSLTKGNVNKLVKKYFVRTDREYIEERTELLTRYIKSRMEKLWITDDEKNDLEKFSERIHLSPDAARDLYRNAVKEEMDRYTKPIFSSELFSPEDERAMYDAAKRLGINLTFPPEIQTKLTKYRRNWDILNGNLPVLRSDIKLQANETLHHRVYISWLEERTVTKRINYSGFTYSTKVAGNLRWKWGSIQPMRVTSQMFETIDRGELYLTNKRILFVGHHGNKTIALNKIIAFEPYTDGLLIKKESGRNPFFACSCDTQEFALILYKLLGNA